MIGRIRRAPSVGDQLGDLRRTLETYVRQQLVEPLQGAGRRLAFGLVGGLLVGLGGILLTLALLRALQTETGEALDGNWSFVPYLVTLLVVSIASGGTLSLVRRKDDRS